MGASPSLSFLLFFFFFSLLHTSRGSLLRCSLYFPAVSPRAGRSIRFSPPGGLFTNASTCLARASKMRVLFPRPSTRSILFRRLRPLLAIPALGFFPLPPSPSRPNNKNAIVLTLRRDRSEQARRATIADIVSIDRALCYAHWPAPSVLIGLLL